MFQQTQRKLLGLYSLLIAVILVVMTGLFYVILVQTVSKGTETALAVTDKKLLGQWQTIQMKLQGNPKLQAQLDLAKRSGTLPAFWDSLGLADAVPLDQVFAVFETTTGRALVHSVKDEATLRALQQAVQARQSNGIVEVGGRSLMILTLPAAIDQRLLVASDFTESRQLFLRMRWLLGSVALGCLLVAAAAGHRFAGWAMVPIERSYKRQQEFVADASHELRTPLAILRTGIEVLEEQRSVLPAFHQGVLSDVKGEVDRMARLVEGLLTLARSDSGRVEIERQPVDLGAVADRAVSSFQLVAAERRVGLTLDGSATVLGDSERLAQLLYILIDNAIKYNRPGGSVTVALGQVERQVELRVTDTGVGIPGEELSHIFERFYRVDKARTRTEGGVGLGLSIAAWIVAAHGGEIRAESQPGEGTTMIVRLPCART